MALKPDRDIQHTNIDFLVSTVAEPGQMLVYGTQGSGVLLGKDRRGYAGVVANPSGYKPVGAVTHPYVTNPESVYHRNYLKSEQIVGEPGSLVDQGWFITNKIIGTPTAGAPAYLSSSGNYTPTLHATGGLTATPLVGEFKGGLDEDGYAPVKIKLA